MSVCCDVAEPLVSRLGREALELLKHGVQKCFYMAYYCRDCGSCRVAVAIPSKRIDCLICGRRCRCHQIGVGFTKRPLPQHEIVSPPIRVEIHGLIKAEPHPEPYRVFV